jgi:hypothetical protein
LLKLDFYLAFFFHNQITTEKLEISLESETILLLRFFNTCSIGHRFGVDHVLKVFFYFVEATEHVKKKIVVCHYGYYHNLNEYGGKSHGLMVKAEDS